MCSGIATPCRDSAHQQRSQERKVEQWRPEREGSASQWDIHLPHFLEPSLDTSVHATPEQDESCSALAQGAKGVLGRAVPHRKHVFFLSVSTLTANIQDMSTLPEWAQRSASHQELSLAWRNPISAQVFRRSQARAPPPQGRTNEQEQQCGHEESQKNLQPVHPAPHRTPNYDRVPRNPTHLKHSVPTQPIAAAACGPFSTSTRGDGAAAAA